MSNPSQSQNDAPSFDSSLKGVLRPDGSSLEPIHFGLDHPFSMTSPYTVDYEGKLYPSASHLWHTLRFLRRVNSGGAEESWHPELSEALRGAREPELTADQWTLTGPVGNNGAIMRSLQRPDWEEIRTEKIDEVLSLKFTQHPGECLRINIHIIGRWN